MINMTTRTVSVNVHFGAVFIYSFHTSVRLLRSVVTEWEAAPPNHSGNYWHFNVRKVQHSVHSSIIVELCILTLSSFRAVDVGHRQLRRASYPKDENTHQRIRTWDDRGTDIEVYHDSIGASVWYMFGQV